MQKKIHIGFGPFLVKNWKKVIFPIFSKSAKTPVLTLFCSLNMTKSNFQVQFADINSRVSELSEVILMPNLSLEFSKNCLSCPIKVKRLKMSKKYPFFPLIGKNWQNYLKV